MKNPNPINLMQSDEVRKGGWAAEARDEDGHLCTTHAPFESDAELIAYVREETQRGKTVTVFPEF